MLKYSRMFTGTRCVPDNDQSICRHYLFFFMQGLNIRVLVDNTALVDRYFTAEPALSLYLECGGKRILFDTGYSGLFLDNAVKMGIGLFDLDYVVLSHGHIDHTGGLPFLMRMLLEAAIEERPHRIPMVVAHPHCFYPRPMPRLADVGSPVDEARLSRQCPVTTSRSPLWLTDDLVFLGEIERTMADTVPDQRKKRVIVTPKGIRPDRIRDDTALAYRSPSGLVIITGCSHSGICNIIEYAKKVCKEPRIRDVIGGLHLKESDKETVGATCEYLKGVRPVAIHPCHCTSLAAKIALAGVAPLGEVGVGSLFAY
jgi:7,8-dihydropterin-6-yl-methyl-4-(beta-D-ribofuranosyl)aminobenzene 5'-phosphate synthase